MAHHGVLFLDELPEFQRGALEALRQPLENGEITIARVHANVTYPAQFHLVAAMNPCRCGHLGNMKRQCGRAPVCGRDYLKRLSGPLLDRFDLFVDVKPVDIRQLESGPQTPTSATTAQDIAALQQHQYVRQGCLNAYLTGAGLDTHAPLTADAKGLLQNAAAHLELSARSYQRVKRVARTLADMVGEEIIQRTQVAEALSYRLV
jgi:magnesium chelatase family protein